MAKRLYQGVGEGSFTSQNNAQYFFVKYRPNGADGLLFPAGTNIRLSELIDPQHTIQIEMQSQNANGNVIMCQKMPLVVLANIAGLQSKEAVYITTDGAEEGQIRVLEVMFPIMLYKECKRLQAGDNFYCSVDLRSGTPTASIEIFNIDAPYQTIIATPMVYRSKAVNANDSQDLPNVPVIYFPNSTAWDLRIFGNSAVVYNVTDFIAQASDEWTSNLTPHNDSDYFGLETSKYSNLQIINNDSTSQLIYYFVKEEIA